MQLYETRKIKIFPKFVVLTENTETAQFKDLNLIVQHK